MCFLSAHSHVQTVHLDWSFAPLRHVHGLPDLHFEPLTLPWEAKELLSMAAWEGEEERRKRPQNSSRAQRCDPGPWQAWVPPSLLQFFPKSLLRKGQVSTKGNRAKEPYRMLRGGERNILTPDSYFLRPIGGSCISV